MLRFDATAITRNRDHPHEQETVVASWDSLAGGESGDPLVVARNKDATVHVTNYAGAGNITIQGSVEPSGDNWFTLTDFQGNALIFSADGAKPIAENVYRIRPTFAAGVTDGEVRVLAGW